MGCRSGRPRTALRRPAGIGWRWRSAAYLVVLARFPAELGRKSVVNLHVAVRHRWPHPLWKIAAVAAGG